MSTLSKKVAIVTGASKGLGAGIATALGAAGARVAVNYSSGREGAERVAQAITDNGGEAIAVQADVSKAADVARLFKEVDSAFGRLDVLVNNAGVFRFAAIAEIFSPCRRRSSGSRPTAGASSTSARLSHATHRLELPCTSLRRAPSKL